MGESHESRPGQRQQSSESRTRNIVPYLILAILVVMRLGIILRHEERLDIIQNTAGDRKQNVIMHPAQRSQTAGAALAKDLTMLSRNTEDSAASFAVSDVEPEESAYTAAPSPPPPHRKHSSAPPFARMRPEKTRTRHVDDTSMEEGWGGASHARKGKLSRIGGRYGGDPHQALLTGVDEADDEKEEHAGSSLVLGDEGDGRDEVGAAGGETAFSDEAVDEDIEASALVRVAEVADNEVAGPQGGHGTGSSTASAGAPAEGGPAGAGQALYTSVFTPDGALVSSGGRSCAAVAQALRAPGSAGPAGLKVREPEELELNWAYRNKAQEDVGYSHMAMVEHLPRGAPARYFAVWQAADRVAGGKDMHVRATMSDDLVRWRPTFKIPLPQKGAIWAPVLFLVEAGDKAHLLLFYTESSTCIRDRPKLNDQAYAPGGDIKVVSSEDGTHWTDPRMVLSQDAEGGVPKVIANRPIRLQESGDLLLPFWREDPAPISRKCHLSKHCEKCHIDKHAPVGLSGTLFSKDHGATWHVGGNIKQPKSVLLLEGTVVQLPSGEVLQLFRSTGGFVYSARSSDGGRSWTAARALDQLPNPGAKVALQALGGGLLALGYNHHSQAVYDESGQKVSTRSRLRVALSADDGATWTTVAKLEEKLVAQTKFHYPTLLDVSNDTITAGSQAESCVVGVLWSVGMKWSASEGGIRTTVLDLADIVHSESGDAFTL